MNTSNSKSHTWKQKTSNFLALFTSTGTLLCCALPSALVAIAGGSSVASLISTFPWLIPLSRYKIWIFLVAGLLIVFSGILIYRPKGKVACSISGGEGCEIAGRFQKFMFWAAVLFYLVGLFFAYALLPIMIFFGY